MNICAINHEQFRVWKETGERPSCKFHHHVSYKKAIFMLENDEAFVDADLQRAIIPYSSLRYMWQGRRSAGFSTLQLAPISGRKSPLGLCAEARRG